MPHEPTTEPVAPAPRIGWRALFVLWSVSAGLLVWVRLWPYQPFLDEGARQIATLGACCSFVTFALLWVALFSGMSWRTRGKILSAAAIVLGVPILLFRVEHVSGDIVPSFTWRFAPKRDALMDDDVAGGQPVDLTVTSANDYPQFRGAQRDGTIDGIELATDFAAHPPRRLWLQEIGTAWSSFAVVHGFAVTQEQRGPHEMVTCYELTTGKLRWTHSDEVRFNSVMAGDGPRGTPTIHEGRVYTLGAEGLLNCLDGASGERIWSRQVVDPPDELPQWGKSASPLIVEEHNLVVISAGPFGKETGPALVAFRADNGEPAWQSEEAQCSYASPMLTTLLDQRQILLMNAESVAGYDPADGRTLWQHQWPGNQPKVPDALPLPPDRVLITAGYGMGTILLQLSPSADDELKAAELWETRTLKPKFANVVIHDGYAYGLDDGMLLACLDLKNGKIRWRARGYGHGQLLLVGNLLLVQCESGEVALIEANPKKHNELSRFTALDGKTWNAPSLYGKYLLVRNDRQAACYELAVGGR